MPHNLIIFVISTQALTEQQQVLIRKRALSKLIARTLVSDPSRLNQRTDFEKLCYDLMRPAKLLSSSLPNNQNKEVIANMKSNQFLSMSFMLLVNKLHVR
jgi:hypothetical protein